MYFHNHVHRINELNELFRTAVKDYVRDRRPDTVSSLQGVLEKLQQQTEDLRHWLEEHQSG